LIMVYVVILFIGLAFIGIGYLLTENNASQLLSGYNTMSKKEQQKLNLKDYIPFFRKFHIFLGSSIIIIGLGLEYFFDGKAAAIFITIYSLIAYLFFVWQGSVFWTNENNPKYFKFVLWLLLLILLGIILLFTKIKTF